MSQHSVKRLIFVIAIVALAGPRLWGQISIEEAEQRLRAKGATRPAATQPAEVEKLREENRRLRARLADLQQEVDTLKESLARANASVRAAGGAGGPGATSRPAAGNALEHALLGRWRGGDITAGSSYILQFDPDGTYKQIFVSTNGSEAGQYQVFEDGTMEMWSSKTRPDRKHNQYHADTGAEQLTLTPLVIDGLEVHGPKPVTLRRAE